MSTSLKNAETRQALLVGKDWFPNIAGGLNRYVYGEVHALPSVGVCGKTLVSSYRPGQSAPLDLIAMADEGASLSARWRGAREAVRRELHAGLDVIHAHFALYTYSWIRDLPREMPLVVHFHGPYALEVAAESRGWKGRLKVLQARIIERAVYRRANRVLTLSEAFRTIAYGEYHIPNDKLTIIPGGVETAPYLAAPERAEARTRLGWPDDRPILITVRRLARRMGLEGLIDAMESVRHDHPRALLLIGGKGVIADELKTRIEQRGLTDNVRLLGFVSDADLPLAYAAANVAVVPTVALEGFGLVTAEALASGTPVLGTAIGGTPEILRGLEPELIFSDTTSEALAAKISAALSGKIRLPEPAECRTYAARYDWSAVAPRLRAVFEEVAHGA